MNDGDRRLLFQQSFLQRGVGALGGRFRQKDLIFLQKLGSAVLRLDHPIRRHNGLPNLSHSPKVYPTIGFGFNLSTQLVPNVGPIVTGRNVGASLEVNFDLDIVESSSYERIPTLIVLAKFETQGFGDL